MVSRSPESRKMSLFLYLGVAVTARISVASLFIHAIACALCSNTAACDGGKVSASRGRAACPPPTYWGVERQGGFRSANAPAGRPISAQRLARCKRAAGLRSILSSAVFCFDW
jgi:hypothetical protein